MAGLTYLAVPAVLVGLGVPVAAVTCWRVGQRLATVIVTKVMRRAMNADDNLASSE